MTTQNKHTPVPWRLSHQVGDGFSIAHEVAPNCGKLIPVATAHDKGGWLEGKLNVDKARANAAFIVRACNCHEELVAVAEMLASLCPSKEGLGGHAPIGAFILAGEKARSALAKAKKEI